MKLQLLLGGASLCVAQNTIVKNFDIGWVNRAPDGYERPVMAVNGEWPCPVIEADLGDKIVVHATNSLGNQSTSLHFHGMVQQGSNAHDGGVGISQCPIQHTDTYTYEFTAEPAGTSWYHGHDKGQYPDGLRGILVVHDREWEESLCIDEQIFLSMSDWYQKEFKYIIDDYLSEDNKNGDIPSPDSFLFNETSQAVDLQFEAGKRYLIRLVSMSSLACGDFHIEGHTLQVVGVDGVHTHPYDADTVKVCAGQRYDIVVEGKSDSGDDEFSWITKMDTQQLKKGHETPEENRAVIGNVAYAKGKTSNYNGYKWSGWSAKWRGKLGKHKRSKKLDSKWNPDSTLNDMKLKPLNDAPLLKNPTKKIELKTNQTYYDGIGSRIATGAQPWSEPKVPTLFTAMSTSDYAQDASTYGPGVDPWVLAHNEVVQVYMENPHDHPHPMHIHGHEFQVVARGKGSWDGDESKLPDIPMMRDTVMIPKKGYLVLRFKADNPGIWFIHCHVDLHLVGGMASTLIEAPIELQKQQIPDKGFDLCTKMHRGLWGNCAGESNGTISAADASGSCNTIWSSSFFDKNKKQRKRRVEKGGRFP